jgi:hypothetical protein
LKLLAVPQRHRLILALLYLAAIGLLGAWALGWKFPPFGLEGLWFYSAGAALILGEFILEPFFARPADAVANGSALLLTAAAVSPRGASVSQHAVIVGKTIFVVYAAAVLALGVAAIWFKDSHGRGGRAGRFFYDVVGTFGRARWVFGALYFAAVYAAFSNSSVRVAVLFLAWVVVFSVHPLERVWRPDRRRRTLMPGAGGVVALEDPRVVLAALPPDAKPRLGQVVMIGAQRGRIVDTSTIALEPHIRVALEEPVPVRMDDVVTLTDEVDPGVVGHVGPGTTIDELVVQAPATAETMALEETELVRAALEGREVLFQITAATLQTKADSVGARDLVEYRARKLGIWDEGGRGFNPVAWVPSPGDVVHRFTTAEGEGAFDATAIGIIPGTTYGVRIELGSAVTHNTAILGILGSGKTHLAWELMKRLLLDRVKIVALDITGRYEPVFDDILPQAYRTAFEARIEAAIAATRYSNVVQNNEAGNVRIFEATLRAALRDWYDSDCPLLILNPLNFDVTKMEGRPKFDGTAITLSRLTMVEVTRLVAEALLEITIEEDVAHPNVEEEARICLVLEEAHSLVPEWNAATGDAEKWAVNGTARAVLQGRKYGFGCVLVTQRTASVTKSILNQCNTIFALRAFDATGAGFLENYVGAGYAPILAALKDRQAVVYGRASSCRTPIVMRLNDAAAFDAAVWAQQKSGLPRCAPDEIYPQAETVELEPPPPEDNDIPF